MSLKKQLSEFAESISIATSSSPDEYASWSSWTYESHKADLIRLWSEIRPQLKRDLLLVKSLDGKLNEMLAAFDAGDKQRGRDAAWMIYNADLERLR